MLLVRLEQVCCNIDNVLSCFVFVSSKLVLILTMCCRASCSSEASLFFGNGNAASYFCLFLAKSTLNISLFDKSDSYVVLVHFFKSHSFRKGVTND